VTGIRETETKDKSEGKYRDKEYGKGLPWDLIDGFVE
jgi:hypothetical protein